MSVLYLQWSTVVSVWYICGGFIVDAKNKKKKFVVLSLLKLRHLSSEKSKMYTGYIVATPTGSSSTQLLDVKKAFPKSWLSLRWVNLTANQYISSVLYSYTTSLYLFLSLSYTNTNMLLFFSALGRANTYQHCRDNP